MKNVLRFCAMGSLCRQQAAYNPHQRWNLLAQAEHWEHLRWVSSCGFTAFAHWRLQPFDRGNNVIFGAGVLHLKFRKPTFVLGELALGNSRVQGRPGRQTTAWC